MEERKETTVESEKQTEGLLPPAKSEKKKGNAARGAAAVLVAAVLLGGVGTSVGMNVVLMDEMRAQKEQGAKMSRFIDDERARQAKEAEKESDYQEDGYKVMGQYEIKSTKQISDAYLKGDPSGLSDEDKKTYDMAARVLGEITKDGMTDYEKELAIYDWMVDNIGHGNAHVITMPGQSSECYTPHDVLASNNAVCVGYATTFRLLANMVGLDVHIVHNESHSWDMVQLDDGEWYQLDVYSDAGGVKYRNFNMTDETARAGHSWDGSSLPEAKGTKYSYAVQNAKPLKNISALPKKIKKALDKKQDHLFFKFPKALTEKELAVADQMMSFITQAMYTTPEGGNLDISGQWIPNGEDDNHILAIYILDYSQSNENGAENLSPEKMSELVKKINEIFGATLADPNESGSEGAVPLTDEETASEAMAEGKAMETVTKIDENGQETVWMVDANGNKTLLGKEG